VLGLLSKFSLQQCVVPDRLMQRADIIISGPALASRADTHKPTGIFVIDDAKSVPVVGVYALSKPSDDQW